MQILECGDYVKNSEVDYYADELFVAPKYLSEVSKIVSGKQPIIGFHTSQRCT